MEDFADFPEESLRQIEALLSRHPPEVLSRMFQHVNLRRNSTVSFASSSGSSAISIHSSASRWSLASTLSTASSAYPPSIASSSSSVSRRTRPEPRSYPYGLDPTRPRPSSHTPSEVSTPVESFPASPSVTDSNISIASPVVGGDQKAASSESYWFCTFCPDMKTFGAKSDWKKHEMRMHETGEDWPCPAPGCCRIFDREKDLVRHTIRYHPGRPLPNMSDIKIQLLPRKVFGCGFDNCKAAIVGWDDRCDHVAKHMKNGMTFNQWKYCNVIHNLIRQDATRDAWKELFLHIDERLRKGRSQIAWCPDNTRILKQKLECCDLRPNRDEVLLTALSLRSDMPVDPRVAELPPGFVTPSLDSVPEGFMKHMSAEERSRILNGDPAGGISHKRLLEITSSMLRGNKNEVFAESPLLPPGVFDTAPSPYPEPIVTEPVVTESDQKRISFMDVDIDHSLDMPQQMDVSMMPPPPPDSLPPPPQPPPTQPEQQMIPQTVVHDNEGFPDPGRTPTTNPLQYCYPNYFDAAPNFEDSQYYDRPSLGKMIAAPLRRVRSGLSSRRSHHSQSPDPARHHSPLNPNSCNQGGVPPPPEFTMSGTQMQTMQYQHATADGMINPNEVFVSHN